MCKYASMQETNEGNYWLDAGVSRSELGTDPHRLDWDPPRSLALVDDEVLCFEDTCPHEDFSLSEGFLEGDVVECAFHFARFCLRTGDVLTQPARRRLRIFEVNERDGRIFVSREPVAREGS